MAIHELKLRARSRNGYFQDHTFHLSIFPKRQDIPVGDHHIRQRVEIEGIDVTARLMEPGVTFQNSLDLVRLNKYVVADCNIPLRNQDGFFRNDIPDNFWQANGLNPSGFMNRVEIFVAYLIGAEWQSFLFFQGQITGMTSPLRKQCELRCFSNTDRLSQFELERSGVGIEKIAELASSDTGSQTPVLEGTYTPERSLLPLTGAVEAEAYHHQDALTLKDVVNDALGVKDNTGYLSASDLKTQGGALEDPLLLNFKTAQWYKKVSSAFDELVKSGGNVTSFYGRFEDVPLVAPHISVRGNIAFNTEPGRITRLPTDWLYNPTTKSLYVLLSNPESHIPDQLVEYCLESDSYHVLHEFTSDVVCYRLASINFNTFYVLCGASTDLDGSGVDNKLDSESFAQAFDSSLAPSDIQIRQYRRAADWEDVYLNSNNTVYHPQLGVHYHVGFTNREWTYEGNAPGRYNSFETHGTFLYYRYATTTLFGVARVDSNQNVSALFGATPDGYENHLNFDWTLDTEGNVYFAYVRGGVFGSTLYIEKHDGTTETQLLAEHRQVRALVDLDEDGGVFLGVHELAYSDGYLYLVVPVGRGNRDIDKAAGSVLYRYGLETLVLEQVDSTDFVQFGFAGLIEHTETGDSEHEKAVYYVQAPVACYRYPAYNPDLASYDSEAGENYLPDFRGNLKRVLPDRKVEDAGTIRFDAEGAFRGLLCRPLVFDDALHLQVVQGSPEDVLQRGAVVSEPSGAVWCEYGRRLNFTLDRLPSTGTLDAALSNMARRVNATYGVDRNVVILENRTPTGATLDNTITETDTEFSIVNLNKTALAPTGYLLVDREIMAYGEVVNNALVRQLGRGQAMTDASVHVQYSEITFLQHILAKSDTVGDDISWKVDTAHLYNTIKDENALIRIKDDLSIFDEKLLTLNMDLDALRIPWLEFVAGNYLHRFKDLRFLLTLSVRASYQLKIGDIVGFHYASPIPPIAFQIMSVTHDTQRTAIVGREVKPDIDIFIDTVVPDASETFYITDNLQDPVLEDGAGNKLIFGGTPRAMDPIPMTLDADLKDMTLTQWQSFGPVKMPGARYGTPPYTYQMRGIPVNTYFDARRREFYGAPDEAQSAKAYQYIVIDANGITHRSAANLTVTAAPQDREVIVDANDTPVLEDGAGNVAIFRGY